MHPRGFTVLERGGQLAIVLALADDSAKGPARVELEAVVERLGGGCEAVRAGCSCTRCR